MTTSKGVSQAAPAKINLSLHVTGQREDGYHLLDSLVAFTELGDEVLVQHSDTLSLNIIGPFSDGLTIGEDNLVLRAARAFGVDQGAKITLTKNLPVASGIGGGSADAAATLRALSRLWNVPLPPPNAIVSLGADVPVCMSADLSRMEGIGDEITRLGALPTLDIVLVNPGVAVPTATVFDGLESKSNAPLSSPLPDPANTAAWLAWLTDQRNDLEPPACAAFPVIKTVLEQLRARHGCTIARMSGSGATCFALFENAKAAQAAQDAIHADHPDWWVHATTSARPI